MTARVVPFPRVRNREFIRRHARRMTEMNQAAGEKHLQRQLELQMDTMRKRGIPEPIIVAEARAVECAIRAELWRVVMQTPGGAA